MKELELLLAALATLGAESKEAFIWWLLLEKLWPGLVWLITLFTGCFMIRWFAATPEDKHERKTPVVED